MVVREPDVGQEVGVWREGGEGIGGGAGRGGVEGGPRGGAWGVAGGSQVEARGGCLE